MQIKLLNILKEITIQPNIPNFNQDLEKLKKWLLENENNFMKFINQIPFDKLNWYGLQTNDDIISFKNELFEYYNNKELNIDIYEDDDDWKSDYLFLETPNDETINISFINPFIKNIEIKFGSNLILIETNNLNEITIKPNIPKQLAKEHMSYFNIDWNDDSTTYEANFEDDYVDPRLIKYLQINGKFYIDVINPEQGNNITVVFYLLEDNNTIVFEL